MLLVAQIVENVVCCLKLELMWAVQRLDEESAPSRVSCFLLHRDSICPSWGQFYRRSVAMNP